MAAWLTLQQITIIMRIPVVAVVVVQLSSNSSHPITAIITIISSRRQASQVPLASNNQRSSTLLQVSRRIVARCLPPPDLTWIVTSSLTSTGQRLRNTPTMVLSSQPATNTITFITTISLSSTDAGPLTSQGLPAL